MLRQLGAIGVLALLAACGQIPGVPATSTDTTSTASTETTFSKPPPNPNSGSAPAGASTPAQAQAPSGPQVGNPVTDRAQFEQLVRNYLNGVQQNNAQGMNPAPGMSDEIQPLQPGGDHRWSINLNGGTNYRIIGACDNECSNVDFELLDPRGQIVASDVLPDDIPIVNHTPASSGRYTLRIIMRTCTIAPCFAGARVLTGGGGGGKI